MSLSQLSIKEPGMSTKATYEITIKGKLPENWADWFNGSIISINTNPGGRTRTTLTCQIRDQAELLGILNRLNSLNLPLVLVSYILKKGE